MTLAKLSSSTPKWRHHKLLGISHRYVLHSIPREGFWYVLWHFFIVRNKILTQFLLCIVHTNNTLCPPPYKWIPPPPQITQQYLLVWPTHINSKCTTEYDYCCGTSRSIGCWLRKESWTHPRMSRCESQTWPRLWMQSLLPWRGSVMTMTQ